MAWNKFVAKLPKGLTKKQRDDIGKDIITYIEDRAIKQGKGFDGSREQKLAKYTKDYAAKKGQSNVDLVLSAKMFNAIEVLQNKSGSVTIGVDKSDSEAGKVEGNVKGTYGKSKPIPGKARPFLGLPEKKLAEIVSKYVS